MPTLHDRLWPWTVGDVSLAAVGIIVIVAALGVLLFAVLLVILSAEMR